MYRESRRDQSWLIARQHLTTGLLNILQTFSGLWSSLAKKRPRYRSDASPQDHVCMPLSLSIIIIIIMKGNGPSTADSIHHTLAVYTRHGLNFHTSILKLHITISFVAEQDLCDILNTAVRDKCLLLLLLLLLLNDISALNYNNT